MVQNECNNQICHLFVLKLFLSLIRGMSEKKVSARGAPQSEGRCITPVLKVWVTQRYDLDGNKQSTDRQVNRGIWRWKDTVWGLFRLYTSQFCYRLQAALILCVSALWMCVCEFVWNTQIKEVRGWGRLLWHLEASTGSSAHLFIDKGWGGKNTSHYIAN